MCLGKVGTSVGKRVFVRNGPRVFTQFAYFQDWLDNKDTFNVSPDLTATPALLASLGNRADPCTFCQSHWSVEIRSSEPMG
jgi:hypothetical protein